MGGIGETEARLSKVYSLKKKKKKKKEKKRNPTCPEIESVVTSSQKSVRVVSEYPTDYTRGKAPREALDIPRRARAFPNRTCVVEPHAWSSTERERERRTNKRGKKRRNEPSESASRLEFVIRGAEVGQEESARQAPKKANHLSLKVGSSRVACAAA